MSLLIKILLAGAIGFSTIMGGISLYQPAQKILSGASLFIIQQGGTGAATFSAGLVAGNGTNPLYGGIATTTASCAGSASCSNFTVLGSSPITITASGGGSGSFASSTPWTAGFLPYIVSDSIFKGIATTSLSLSGFPATIPATLGALVGGSNTTWTYYGLSTTSPISASQVLYGTSASGVASVATSTVAAGTGVSLSANPGYLVNGSNLTITNTGVISGSCTWPQICSGTNPLAITWGGFATTSQPASSNLLVSNGTTGVFGVATTSVTCSGSVSCTGFTAIGASPITLTGIGATFGQAWEIGANGHTGFLAPTTTLSVYVGQATSTLFSANQAWFGATATSSFSAAGVLSLATPLSVANGGTGAATLTGCLTGNGTGAITGSGTCNVSNASVSSIATTWPIVGGTITTTGTITWGGLSTSTPAVVSNIPYFSGVNTFANVATSSQTYSSGFSNSGTLGATVGGTTNVTSLFERHSFTYATTTWTGTTTIPLEVGYGEIWQTAQCYTNIGTLAIQIGYGSASTTAFNASTTVGTITLTPNNTMTAGNKVVVDLGSPATAPTKITCTIKDLL